MSGPVASCPSCGASVAFRWAGAVQTTCDFCDSILVRHGTELERVGEVSEPPPVTSPVQLGTEGVYRGRPFTVVGRIVYGYERGGWSEWHLIFSDGESGWLSDAMDEYSVSFLVDAPGALPGEDELEPGMRLTWGERSFELTDMTPARYVSTEGELPWEYHDRDLQTFADLRSPDGGIVTLDYSEDPPLLFRGEYMAFDELRMENLREDAGGTVGGGEVGGVRTLSCPNCASSVTVHRSGISVNVVCESCASVLDATSPGAEVLQTFEKKAHRKPQIPLGSTGRFKGAEYMCLGFQVRSVRSEGVRYEWTEYLLHHPEEGYRYLTQENGHWNDAIVLKTIPKKIRSGGQPVVELHGEKFKHFEEGVATTDYVLGEWPWEVRVGDRVRSSDFVHPPRLVSLETTEDERVWSLAEYMDPGRVWDAFDLPGEPPKPDGVYPNQPSPYEGRVGRMWTTFAVLLLLLAGLYVARRAILRSEMILTEQHEYVPSAAGAAGTAPAGQAGGPDAADGAAEAPTESPVVVLGPFTLGGRTSNLAIDVDTDVSNEWIYFDYALLDTGTGTAREFGREVGYYFGRSGGESWTEGSREDRAVIPSVPPGEYMLRVAPEGRTEVSYRITLHRDVPVTMFWVAALVLLLIPPLVVSLRRFAFESRRWSESDYADDD